MKFDIDIAIFTGFLIVNLVLGLTSSRGVKNVKEYAIGNRNFSTATIAATLVATWIGGDWFFNYLSETYSGGLYVIWASIGGNVLCVLSVGLFFAPRLAEFLGKLSVAEAMGDLYGKHVRVITAIAGFIGGSGIIAVQLKVSGLLFEYCFAIPGIYGILISGTIITLYSTLGGIKSVTFTDIIQFFTFGTIIPTIVFFLLGTLDSIDIFINTFKTHELFDYKQVFDFTRPKSIYYLFLFFFTFLPAFNPAIFQRIAMARNTKQVGQSFTMAAFIALLIGIMLAWIGTLLLSTKPDLNTNDIVKHILFDYSYPGLKGLTLAGIMAMIMSTADSYVNSTSILFVHDFCKPLKINIIKNELTFCRLGSLLIGALAITLALRSGSLLQLFLAANMFYMPIVTVPFIMSTLGFRSSSKSVLIGMIAGLIGVVVWEMFFKIANIDGLIPGMVTNLVFLLGSHYLLKQTGGWVGIKDNTPLLLIRRERKAKMQNILNSIINFDLYSFFRNNSLKSESMYCFFGLFCIISIYSTMHAIPKELKLSYPTIINFIHITVLFMATILLSYPLWLQTWKDSIAGSVFYILIFAGFLLVIMSNFAQLQLVAFMFNLIVIAALVKWQWALFLIVTGLITTVQIFKFYVGIDNLSIEWDFLEFKTTYILLFVSSILIVFLKPKQQYQELMEEKNEYLNSKIGTKDKETQEALALKAEFIRNVNHEYHAPMTGVISMAEILVESYHKLNDQQRLEAAEVILKSSRSLKAFDDNLTTLAYLSKPHYALKKEDINFSDLVYDRVQTCRRLYEENKEDREFILDIYENVMANVDRTHMTQLLDNLIINSISYCKKGQINVTLSQDKDNIHFVISDTGIGIPKNEIYEIFEPFTVGSRTKTPAGGRGLGLAICKRIIEVHSGTIKDESNGIKGAIFRVELPR